MKSNLLHSRVANLLASSCMAGLWALFALRHIAAFKSTGNVTYLLFCISESITAAFFAIAIASRRDLPIAAVTGALPSTPATAASWT